MLSGKNLYRLRLPLFQTESKKEKEQILEGEKFPQVLFYLNTTYPQFPVLCVSARQEGKNLRVLPDEWASTVVFTFQKEKLNTGA